MAKRGFSRSPLVAAVLPFGSPPFAPAGGGLWFLKNLAQLVGSLFLEIAVPEIKQLTECTNYAVRSKQQKSAIKFRNYW